MILPIAAEQTYESSALAIQSVNMFLAGLQYISQFP
jgi:hypothetical protein